MKKRVFHPLPIFAAAALLTTLVFAKDDPISLERCPVPVQNVIKQYAVQAKLEEIGLDKKSKSGGSPVYEAKFTGKDGKRFELHISPDGKVLEIEPKKPKL
jgi:hypothetical protein